MTLTNRNKIGAPQDGWSRSLHDFLWDELIADSKDYYDWIRICKLVRDKSWH